MLFRIFTIGTREREGEDEYVFLFLLCATDAPSILRRIFQTSSHPPIMNSARTGRFILFLCYHSFSLSFIHALVFSYFLFYVKRRLMRIIFHTSLFDNGQFISDSFAFTHIYYFNHHDCSSSFSIYWRTCCHCCCCLRNYRNFNYLLVFSWYSPFR